jgi:chlorite dismutase
LIDIPAVPLTLEGKAMLHQVFEFDWKAWCDISSADRNRIILDTLPIMREIEHAAGDNAVERSALYSLLGHKGDIMMVHLRDSLHSLNQVELTLSRTRLFQFLNAKYSYLSVVELGLYDSSVKTYTALAEKGVEQHTSEWNEVIADVLSRQRGAMSQRLYPSIPPAKYLCFYPMDRRRGETVNWYALPIAERQRLMHDHGMIGRRYADRVRQVISGSIGLDDWEWGVDLFADDPIVFKQVIYEMRFDEASSMYAEFGSFYTGIRLPLTKLGKWLSGSFEEGE